MTSAWIDIETTGFGKEKSPVKIFELAFGIQGPGGKPEKFESYLTNLALEDFEEGALKMHRTRIENTTLSRMAERDAIRETVKRFKESNVTELIGYNIAGYDYGALIKRAQQLGLSQEVNYLRSLQLRDVLDVSNEFLKQKLAPYKDILRLDLSGEPRYRLGYSRLESLAQGFNIAYTAHEAEQDIKLTYQIYGKIMEDAPFDITKWYFEVQRQAGNVVHNLEPGTIGAQLAQRQNELSIAQQIHVRQELENKFAARTVEVNIAEEIAEGAPKITANKISMEAEQIPRSQLFKLSEKLRDLKIGPKYVFGVGATAGLFLTYKAISNLLDGSDGIPEGIRQEYPNAYNEFEGMRDHEDYNFPGSRTQCFYKSIQYFAKPVKTSKIRDQCSRNPHLPFPRTPVGGKYYINGSRANRRN